MGYFNYFIKCLIRRFVSLFFTKKTFIVILVFVSLFVFLKSEGYCSSDSLLSPGYVSLYKNDTLRYSLSPLPNSDHSELVGYYYYYLRSGSSYRIHNDGSYYLADVIPIIPTTSRSNITSSISESYEYTVVSGHVPFYSDKDYVFTSGFTGYVLVPNNISRNVQFYQLSSAVEDVLTGNKEEFLMNISSFSLVNGLFVDNTSFITDPGRSIYYFELPDYETYNYTINLSGKFHSNTHYGFSAGFCDFVPANGVRIYDNFLYNLTSSNNTFSTTFNSSGHRYFYVRNIPSLSLTFESSRNFKSNLGSIQDSIDSGANKTQQTITDSNVEVSTSLPTDNTQDITESGFDNIFTTIKNTFTSSNSQDLVLVIPFTGKSFTINFANVYRWI